MTNLQLPKYDIEYGSLANTYGLFVSETINTGAQISVDMITDKSLRSIWFYTANVSLATKRNGKLLFGIGGNAAFNVVFGTDTQTVCTELNNTGYIHLTPAKQDLILMLEKSGEVVFVEPNYMKLKGQESEYRQFTIRTNNYEKDVTIARMPFVSAGYGSGDMLAQVMNNLANEKIVETNVYTMSPDNVAENVEDDKIVARASRLDGFDNGSSFLASVRNVYGSGALRGVRCVESAKGGEKNYSSLESLVGKGNVAHGDIAVVKQGDVSDEAWKLLTKKQ